MTRRAVLAPILAALLVLGSPLAPGWAPSPAAAQQAVPFDGDLRRLAEILGALHYLRELCGAAEGQKWRNEMQQLVDALCARFGADRAALVRWAPDPQVERLFAAYPPLRVPEAEAVVAPWLAPDRFAPDLRTRWALQLLLAGRFEPGWVLWEDRLHPQARAAFGFPPLPAECYRLLGQASDDLALERLLVGVHGVGDVDGEHQLDVDGAAGLGRGQIGEPQGRGGTECRHRGGGRGRDGRGDEEPNVA